LDAINRPISRELHRNKGKRGYRPDRAQKKVGERKRLVCKAIKPTPELKTQIKALIQENGSHEQVSGYLKKKNIANISHELIYQLIKADKLSASSLYRHLRCHKKKYKKRYAVD